MKQTNLEGRNVVLDALTRDRKIFEILIDAGAKGDKIADIQKLAAKKGIKVSLVERAKLDKMSVTDSHQGIIGLAEPIQLSTLAHVLKEEQDPFILVLRDVLYEHNLGAILRSAAAAGVSAVVVDPGKKDVLTPVVERVSMGGSNVVKVCEESVYSALSQLKKAGVRIVGVEVGGTKNYFEDDLTGSVALVFGGEDEGLSLPIREKCDIVVSVPMQGGIQSLNLSVSVGVLLFEKVSQDYEYTKRKV